MTSSGQLDLGKAFDSGTGRSARQLRRQSSPDFRRDGQAAGWFQGMQRLANRFARDLLISSVTTISPVRQHKRGNPGIYPTLIVQQCDKKNQGVLPDVRNERAQVRFVGLESRGSLSDDGGVGSSLRNGLQAGA
jgi:hypothetical protein